MSTITRVIADEELLALIRLILASHVPAAETGQDKLVKRQKTLRLTVRLTVDPFRG